MSWLDSLDLSKVSDEDRFRVLEYAVSKHGREKVREVLGVSRITMWRLLSRQVRVDDSKLRALLSIYPSERRTFSGACLGTTPLQLQVLHVICPLA